MARVSRLVILGHPAGPLVLDTPIPPRAVVIMARRRISLSSTGQQRSRRVLFGFLYEGQQQVVMQIEDDGAVSQFIGAVHP